MRALRCVLSVVVVLSLAAVAASSRGAADEEAPAAASGVADLGWMSGRWVGGGGGEYLEETWGPAAGDTLVGMFRWMREGKVFMYELMCVEQDENGDVAFTLRHFSRGLEPWKEESGGGIPFRLVERDGQRAVFENAESKDLRQFVYSREGDVLTIALVRPGADGKADHEHAEVFGLTLAE